MKKRIFLTSVLTLIASLSFVINADENVAKIVAESFLSSKVGTYSNGCIATPMKGSRLKSIQGIELTDIYVYNAIADNRPCFVLMAKDNDVTRIIGYGFNSQLDFENLPFAMQEWLSEYTTALDNTSSASPREVTTQAVEPILKTQWNQFAPFNNMCPTYDDHRTVAGCTAIALAQVLYHFKSDNTSPYKVEYLNEPTTTEITVDFSKGGYDWDNMLNTYKEGQYNDTQAQAVARLAYEAGVACKAEYGFASQWDYSVSNFSTKAPLPFEALQRYFDFKCDIMSRNLVPTQIWIDIINQNLREGNPVIYAGSGDNSHAFVIDGVDDQGLYHVNWGWGGDADGYFDLTYLRIDDETHYGKNQQMIANIAPRKASDKPYEMQLAVGGCAEFNDYGYGDGNGLLYFECVTTNFRDKDYFEAYNTFFAFVITDENGNILAENKYNELAYPDSYVFSSYNDYDVTKNEIIAMIEDNKLADGTYLINIASKRGDDDKATLCLMSEVFQPKIKVTNGQYELINVWGSNGQTEVRNVYTASEAYAGSDFYLGLTLFDTTPFDSFGILNGGLYFENCETSELYFIDQSLKHPITMPGVEQEAVYRVRPTKDNGFSMPAGKYKFVIKDTTYSYTTDDFYIDIEEKPSFPVIDCSGDNLKILDEYMGLGQYSRGLLRTSGIVSANLVGGKARFNIYATPVGGGEETFVASIPDIEIKANSGCADDYIPLPNNFYPLIGEYDFTIRYISNCAERPLLNPNLKPYRRVIGIGHESLLQPLIAESQELSIDYSVALGQTQSVMIKISNYHTADFEGVIKALFIDKSTGECVEGESENVSIATSETTMVPIKATFQKDGNYDVYLTSTAVDAYTYDNWYQPTTPITTPSGKRSVSTLHLDYASAENINIDREGLEIVAIYDLQGNKLSKFSSGVNIVLWSDGSAKKVIVR